MFSVGFSSISFSTLVPSNAGTYSPLWQWDPQVYFLSRTKFWFCLNRGLHRTEISVQSFFEVSSFVHLVSCSGQSCPLGTTFLLSRCECQSKVLQNLQKFWISNLHKFWVWIWGVSSGDITRVYMFIDACLLSKLSVFTMLTSCTAEEESKNFLFLEQIIWKCHFEKHVLMVWWATVQFLSCCSSFLHSAYHPNV